MMLKLFSNSNVKSFNHLIIIYLLMNIHNKCTMMPALIEALMQSLYGISMQHTDKLVMPGGVYGERALTYVRRAIDDGLMHYDAKTGKLTWLGSGFRAHNASLAYFLAKAYGYEYREDEGRNHPLALILKSNEMEELFGIRRLHSSLVQALGAKNEQAWKKQIDSYFD